MVNNNGIQLWTVPVTGNYTIRAVGANAAQFSTGTGQNGNRRGIDISTTTTLNKGEVIKILVGQQGGINSWSQSGGGTFIVRDIKTPIIVAGGGSGGNGDSFAYENSGGGGLIGNGIKDAESITPGLSFINGGLGGNSEVESVGGFGGSGSTRGGFGGAGGGYSGGGGGNNVVSQYAAGGGSYAINTMTINGYNSSGQGSVTITLN
jgi:hypothetical protein